MAQTWLGRIKTQQRREGRHEGEVLAAQRAVQQAILVRFPEWVDEKLGLTVESGLYRASFMEITERIRNPVRLVPRL